MKFLFKNNNTIPEISSVGSQIRMGSLEACKNGNFEDTKQSGEKRFGWKWEADRMFSLFSKK